MSFSGWKYQPHGSIGEVCWNPKALQQFRQVLQNFNKCNCLNECVLHNCDLTTTKDTGLILGIALCRSMYCIYIIDLFLCLITVYWLIVPGVIVWYTSCFTVISTKNMWLTLPNVWHTHSLLHVGGCLLFSERCALSIYIHICIARQHCSKKAVSMLYKHCSQVTLYNQFKYETVFLMHE